MKTQLLCQCGKKLDLTDQEKETKRRRSGEVEWIYGHGHHLISTGRCQIILAGVLYCSPSCSLQFSLPIPSNALGSFWASSPMTINWIWNIPNNVRVRTTTTSPHIPFAWMSKFWYWYTGYLHSCVVTAHQHMYGSECPYSHTSPWWKSEARWTLMAQNPDTWRIKYLIFEITDLVLGNGSGKKDEFTIGRYSKCEWNHMLRRAW